MGHWRRPRDVAVSDRDMHITVLLLFGGPAVVLVVAYIAMLVFGR